eukprot:CAMPEP_0172303918 /NCGR_PEP_ID=MMETSP1058-20130122/5413_1 /TAXON_ID=83371 /ORGANISM="Detonula confervacea, Strain CCMP 353" /LENGTH=406 /DNA_ID=CAMNT_0013014955 /DNA_START=85 /DNA_END=1302 /DNA_ORIENTATION=-
MDDDLNTASLPTITEEDGESVRSGSTAKSNQKSTGEEMAAASAGDAQVEGAGGANNEGKKEKKKKRKGKNKDASAASYSAEDHDTAQQILVDLCSEMRDLKNAMQNGQDKTGENLDSNQQIMRRLADQMEMLQGNMKQLDQVIESKATPEQIEELSRIRAVQEMMRVVTDDKERTVAVYEQHARRGYEEIERLRQDLASERKEVAALRAELDIVRGDRQRMASSMTSNGLAPGNMYINAVDSFGEDSGLGALYVNGSGHRSSSGGRGDFDDMTLETRGSMETAVYEVKSLKKRIIHMKKKLTVAQMEAKESGELRAEVERLRVRCETEKKASQAKDATIKHLENDITELKRNQANAAAALAAVSMPRTAVAMPGPPATSARSPPQATKSTRTSSKTVVSHSKKQKW